MENKGVKYEKPSKNNNLYSSMVVIILLWYLFVWCNLYGYANFNDGYHNEWLWLCIKYVVAVV